MNIWQLLPFAICLLPIFLIFGAFITTQKAAEMMDVNQRHVSRLVKGGQIKGQKFGHVYMVDEDSVKEYMNNRPKPGPKRKE